jgi:predicted dehydrogenase
MSIALGFIGSGFIATQHAKAFAAAGAEVACFCDTVAGKAQRLAYQYGARVVPSVAELLAMEDVDAIVVGVPNALHRPCAIDALRAGKDVLLEKPMALNTGECDQIIAALRDSDRILQVGFVTRCSPTAVAAKRLVDDGRLGRVYHAKASMYRRRGIPGLGRWFTTASESGGGVLIDLGVHLLDLVMHLTDHRHATRVSASCAGAFGHPLDQYTFQGEMWAGPPDLAGVFDVEDAAAGLVRFDGGLTLEINATWAVNLPPGSLPDGVALLGDRGGLFFDPWGQKVLLATEEQGCLTDVTLQTPSENPFDVAFLAQARLFIEAVSSRMQPAATADHGRGVQAILDAMYRSSAQAREVEIL